MSRNKKKFNVDFFLAQESFIDWARGNNSSDSEWEEWVSKHPESLEQFNDAFFIASEIKIEEEDINPVWINNIKNRIDESIEAKNTVPLHSSKKRFYSYKRLASIYFAASVSLVLCVSILISYYLVNDTLPASQVYSTKEAQEGQKLSFYLNDGTKVKLNALSSLTYSEFDDSSRKVFLTGEAFFDVVKDSFRPFTVIANGLQIKVLGTSFNVNSKKEGNEVTVALVSGEVELLGENKNNIKLYPGQVARMDKDSELKFVQGDIHMLTAWKDGIIIFEKASMQEVLDELSKWYGVHFKISGVDPEYENWMYTGNFDNQSLRVVLMSLSYVKGFHFEINKDTVYIKY